MVNIKNVKRPMQLLYKYIDIFSGNFFKNYIFIRYSKNLANYLRRYESGKINNKDLSLIFNKKIKDFALKEAFFPELKNLACNEKIKQEYIKFTKNIFKTLENISNVSENALYAELQEWILNNSTIKANYQFAKSSIINTENNTLILRQFTDFSAQENDFNMLVQGGFNSNFDFTIIIDIKRNIDEIMLRIPGWAAGYLLKINDEQVDDLELIPPLRELDSSQFEKARYLTVPDLEIGRNIIQLSFSKLPYSIYENDKKHYKQAIGLGPFLYAASQNDNLGINIFDPNIEITGTPELVDEKIFIKAISSNKEITLVFKEVRSIPASQISNSRIWFNIHIDL